MVRITDEKREKIIADHKAFEALRAVLASDYIALGTPL